MSAKRNVWIETVTWVKSLDVKGKILLVLGLIGLFVVSHYVRRESCETLKARAEKAENEYQWQLRNVQGFKELALAAEERDDAMAEYNKQCKSN